MTGSAVRNSNRVILKASSSSGHTRSASIGLKNVSRTAGHPGEVTTTTPTTTKKMTVLTVATVMSRRRRRAMTSRRALIHYNWFGSLRFHALR